jgi:2-polyprenyl-3-methyl-5-hydroxy-6-metoxy-1,4-benzoquinol methylase
VAIERISSAELRDITSRAGQEVAEHDRDEMAIPSYLHANPLIRWLMWRRYEVIAELAGLDGCGRALEFGCGTGLFLPTLAQSCAEVVAIDLFPQFARELVHRRRLEERVRFVDDLEAIADGSLDLIVAADVMEHLDAPEATARRFHAKLRPGGVLLVSGPTESAVYKLGRVLAGFAGKGDYHHTNIDALEQDIRRAGFALERSVRLPFSLLPCLFKVHRFVSAAPATPR